MTTMEKRLLEGVTKPAPIQPNTNQPVKTQGRGSTLGWILAGFDD